MSFSSRDVSNRPIGRRDVALLARRALAAIAAVITAAPGLCEVSLPLGTKVVRLELVSASIEVVIDGSVEPSIALESPLRGLRAGDLFVVEESADAIVVQSRADAPSGAPPAKLTAMMKPTQTLELTGHDVEASISTIEKSEAGSEGAAGPGSGGVVRGQAQIRPRPTWTAAVTINVTASTIMLDRLAMETIRIVSNDSDIRLEECAAALEVTSTGGATELRFHRGISHISAEGSQLQVSGHGGRLSIETDGGSASIEGGSGQLSLDMKHTTLQAHGWQGTVSVAGEGATGSMTGMELETLDVTATDSYLSILDSVADVSASCASGSLTVEGCTGQVTVLAQDSARINVKEISGSVEMNLRSGAEATLIAISSSAIANVDNAFLRVDGVSDLKLTAADSRIDLRDVGNPQELDLAQCSASLDFTGSSGILNASASRGSDLDIRLQPPCEVRVRGPGEFLQGAVTVVNCTERKRTKNPKENAEHDAGLIDRGLTAINLHIDGFSQARVSGN